MPLVYRPAQTQDLARADALVVASINDLTERHGFGSMATARPPNFQLFSLKDDPDGLWVAEDGGDILGFAWSWVCGDLWFLAQLFVDPAQQGRGIGNELLKLTLEHARKSGAAHKALITFTFNRVSQGLYIRHGLFPKMPIYFFGATRECVIAALPDVPLSTIVIEGTAAQMKHLAEIDARAVGVAREKHHRYLHNDPATKGVMLYSGDDCVGYTYIGSDGHIGPLAVTRTEVLGDVFTTALKMAADGGSEQISAFLPGTCDSALSLAVKQGMRITFPMLLMASPGFGDWAQYLPRNPGFM
jgi:ribosomal protein S18 acetylase RimI-like enzyme